MISHFQWKVIKDNLVRSEWAFSFFYSGSYYKGTYFKDGSIEWQGLKPDEKVLKDIELHIHDLMLYHVYEKH
ncbi:DUF5342 family protein [Anaerobacillus sp. MEB173]|uniref:DUF5342 family protein n=1 Tax=Anaerobacillus sp. MEB173 TaxID=3383345 RepID=UPI003F8E2938